MLAEDRGPGSRQTQEVVRDLEIDDESGTSDKCSDFRARKRFSSGVVEGLNNKVKVTMRKSYGFRIFRVTEIALYHALGKLPEPELPHRFY